MGGGGFGLGGEGGLGCGGSRGVNSCSVVGGGVPLHKSGCTEYPQAHCKEGRIWMITRSG